MKVAFETIGCRSNFADTLEMQGQVVKLGAECVPFSVDADVYVLNTCTVTNSADVQARRMVRSLRVKHPAAKIVVMGCLAEVGFRECQEAQLVDAIIGTSQKSKVIAAIFGTACNDQAASSDGDLVRIGGAKSQLAALSSPIPAPGTEIQGITPRARFHLRIQDGCDNFCTYCIVPIARGRAHNKPVSQVVEEIKRLTAVGYDEVVLTGTHLGAYGQKDKQTLLDLLLALAHDGCTARIRISSLDPNDLSRELIDFIASSGLVCEHLHLCFQSFSDKMLKLMNRHYQIADVVSLVDYAVSKVGRLCIGSDIICGFPQETASDYQQEVAVFNDLPLSYLHVFPYSERKGTAATRLTGVVPVAERRERARQWRTFSMGRRYEFLRRLLGGELEVVAEKIADGIVWGTSREYASCRCSMPIDPSQIEIGKRYKMWAQSVADDKESIDGELK